MAVEARWTELGRVIRYYFNGVVNTAFGYGLFAGLVALGMNMYGAQALSHVLGVAFNYFTFSRITFADRVGSKGRFVLSYALNYVMSVAILAGLSRFIASPYGAGLATIVIVSALNYLLLKRLVFNRTAAT
ncbi:GtrA-like protein [Novosphingobium kunmingense]|uniref:GtrA-like protein n=1 Tax=Novosphingobium kunmingense TaxID=1211806 RepID=A0A2N0H6K7_9SPHN|nr:GtrA family protein [Novosphingobium kunmingense]PKB14530.1 GtrA-like protein [Novosphingobium kunmingense]